jgi:hypothetical protein
MMIGMSVVSMPLLVPAHEPEVVETSRLGRGTWAGRKVADANFPVGCLSWL